MAFFMQSDIVQYACVCGLLNSITNLYFCKYCLQLRCGFCVCHEVDSHFCSNCLENIPSSEAKHRKNRCNTCFNCPSCQNTLSVRASTATLPAKTEENKEDEKKEEKQITRKLYYLACLTCRWTSRDVGIPDQTVATGQWPELEYLNATRFSMLLEHYQSVVLHEKQEKQELWRRKAPKQSKYPSLTDKTGLTVSMVRRQLGWSDSKTQIKMIPSTVKSAVASEDVEELCEEIFTQPINLKNITNLQQRLSQPAKQPYTVNKLYPQHKLLSIKRSLRCRQCEHNVIKSEYNPSSIKYRIALFASYHVPEVRFVKCDLLEVGKESFLLLKIVNPTINDMTITIMDLPTIEDELMMIEELKISAENASATASHLSITGLTSTLQRPTPLNEDPRVVAKKLTGSFKLPDSSFIVNRRDDSAEFDEIIPSQQQEDPKFIVWRKANQIAIKLAVKPNEDAKIGEDAFIGFSMQYTYVSVTSAADKTSTPTVVPVSPLRQALTTRVFVNIGKLTQSAEN